MPNPSERVPGLAYESGHEETAWLLTRADDVRDGPNADGALEPG